MISIAYRQWAAVITHLDEMILPPQKCPNRFCNDTWYGAKPSAALVPPTMRVENGEDPTEFGGYPTEFGGYPTEFGRYLTDLFWKRKYQIRIK